MTNCNSSISKKGQLESCSFDYLVSLQKTLGHSDLAMTRKYANLLTEDLQKVHQKVSLLSGGTLAT